MNANDIQTKPAQSVASHVLFCFWRDELTKNQKALSARLQSERTWRSGTSESWGKVGCRKTKAERLQQADSEARIANKYRERVDAIEATIVLLSRQNGAAVHPVTSGDIES